MASPAKSSAALGLGARARARYSARLSTPARRISQRRGHFILDPRFGALGQGLVLYVKKTGSADVTSFQPELASFQSQRKFVTPHVHAQGAYGQGAGACFVEPKHGQGAEWFRS